MIRSCLVVAAVALMWPFAARAEELPVPSEDALEGPLALIKEVYGEEHANARTKEQLQALAKKLISEASKAAEPVERYALLRVARDIAAQGSDGLMAFEIIDDLDESFQVDAVKMKASVLHSLTKQARLPADRKDIAQQALVLADLAVARDDCELSGKLAEMALSEARKVRDTDFVKRVAARADEIDELRAAFSKVKTAAEKLVENPTDPEANLAVGRYRCLVKGDWETGLPMLALGSDAALKDLALKELDDIANLDEQAKLGDGWWNLAEGEDGTAQRQFQGRAGHWYRKAIAGLTGLRREQLQQRLAQISAGPGGTEFPPGAVLILTFDRHTLVRSGNRTYVKDLSGRGNHGLVNATQMVRGKAGDAFSFTPKGAYVECSNTESLCPTDAMSVCAWVNARAWRGAATDYVVSKEDWKAGSRGYVLRGTSSGKMGFTIAGKGWSGVSSAEKLETGKWYHIAATFDGERMIMYVNGTVSGTAAISRQIPPSSYNLRIGRGHYSSGRCFDGVIDEVAIFARALTGDEIAAIYQLGNGGKSLDR